MSNNLFISHTLTLLYQTIAIRAHNSWIGKGGRSFPRSTRSLASLLSKREVSKSWSAKRGAELEWSECLPFWWPRINRRSETRTSAMGFRQLASCFHFYFLFFIFPNLPQIRLCFTALLENFGKLTDEHFFTAFIQPRADLRGLWPEEEWVQLWSTNPPIQNHERRTTFCRLETTEKYLYLYLSGRSRSSDLRARSAPVEEGTVGATPYSTSFPELGGSFQSGRYNDYFSHFGLFILSSTTLMKANGKCRDPQENEQE